MTDDTVDDFFTAKHARLTRIASIANTFVWIVFSVNLIFVFGKLSEVQRTYSLGNLSQTTGFWEMLRSNPLYASSIFVDMLSILLNGVVFALVLKGISLGLNMIVETDINYRATSQEETYE